MLNFLYEKGANGIGHFTNIISQPGNWEELVIVMYILGVVRYQEESWQEPYELRGSHTDLSEAGGQIPLVYPTYLKMKKSNRFLSIRKWKQDIWRLLQEL